jgi:hypothetical protein
MALQPRPAHAASWQQGALVGLVMVSLMILMLLGVITIFSAMSATLLTTDSLLIAGFIGLSIALFTLLARSQRRQV